MSMFEGDFFDGKSSRPRRVRILIGEDGVFFKHPEQTFFYPFTSLRIDPSVGNARSILFLEDGGEVHSDTATPIQLIEERLQSRSFETVAKTLENNILYVLLSLALTAILTVSTLWYGIPLAARHLASVLPDETAASAGEESLAALDQFYLSPTRLNDKRQKEIVGRIEHFCTLTRCPPYRLVFRDSPRFGANAFALPDNTIILTDQLIHAALHNDEIVAVAAHELGHIHGRHSMRMLLQAIGSGIFLILVTGDVAAFSDLAAAFPPLLLQQGYSRAMENEADSFALTRLDEAGIPRHRFADILRRIDTNETAGAFFSSHPDTAERIRVFLESN